VAGGFTRLSAADSSNMAAVSVGGRNLET
jgi:hypothetical protein